MAEQELYQVMGGRVSDPRGTDFKDPESIHVVGVFSSYDDAVESWRAQAQRTVDDAEQGQVAGADRPSSQMRSCELGAKACAKPSRRTRVSVRAVLCIHCDERHVDGRNCAGSSRHRAVSCRG